jgi:soluble lytic murein transglycosylase-like protein
VLRVGKGRSWRGRVAERCARFAPLIAREAAAHGLDAALLVAIARIESGFTPDARSRGGATGLMQVMPSTGKRLGCGDLTDPDVNVACAAKLLRKLLDYYDGELVYALSGYARGLGHATSRRREGRAPSAGYLEVVVRERARYLRHGCDGPEPPAVTTAGRSGDRGRRPGRAAP